MKKKKKLTIFTNKITQNVDKFHKPFMIFVSVIFVLSTLFNLSILKLETKAVANPVLLDYARSTPRLQYNGGSGWLMDMIGFSYNGNEYKGIDPDTSILTNGHLYVASVIETNPPYDYVVSDGKNIGVDADGIDDIYALLFDVPALGGGITLAVPELDVPHVRDEFIGYGGTPALDPFKIWEAKGAITNYEWVYSAASSAKAITSFNFSGLDPAVTGTVNETAKTVSLIVPYGTAVTALVPTIVVSALASVSPLSGVAHNFTTPQTYTVTAEDATTQPYIVTVTIALPPPAYVAPPDSIVTPPSPEPPAPVVPEPVVEPVVMTDDYYFKTVIQPTSIPEFNSEWGVGYSKDGQEGRTAWALEHRFNIYQSYIDILGRKPTAIEVNWWLTQEDDIWVIRWFFLNSEEYRNK